MWILFLLCRKSTPKRPNPRAAGSKFPYLLSQSTKAQTSPKIEKLNTKNRNSALSELGKSGALRMSSRKGNHGVQILPISCLSLCISSWRCSHRPGGARRRSRSSVGPWSGGLETPGAEETQGQRLMSLFGHSRGSEDAKNPAQAVSAAFGGHWGCPWGIRKSQELWESLRDLSPTSGTLSPLIILLNPRASC